MKKMWKEGIVEPVMERVSAPENSPPYISKPPLGRRGEMDPPPWGADKGLYPVLTEEKGLYPVVSATF